MPTETEAVTGEVVVIGPNYWGRGPDLLTAKVNFRKVGGRLSNGYRVLTFDDDTEFLGVNDMGYYSWRGNPPVEKDVAPR